MKYRSPCILNCLPLLWWLRRLDDIWSHSSDGTGPFLCCWSLNVLEIYKRCGSRGKGWLPANHHPPQPLAFKVEASHHAFSTVLETKYRGSSSKYYSIGDIGI